MSLDLSRLSGFYKEIYGDSLEKLVPENSVLVKRINFSKQDKIGNKFHQNVLVSMEKGFTHAGPSAGAFTLNSSIGLRTQDAQVDGFQFLLRSAAAYNVLTRATSSKEAFMEATSLIFENMVESMTQRLEVEMLYGSNGLGLTSGSVNQSATTTRVQLTAATWASGIWAGQEDLIVNFYNSTPTQIGGDFTIYQIDTENRYLFVSGSAGDITALDAATAGGLDIFFDGAFGNEMAGLDEIITNTGTLFNISATTYNLWKANTFSTSGQLSMAKVLAGLSKAVDRGLKENVICLVNPKTWTDLHADQAALRLYDSSYSKSKFENGAEDIRYHYQNGMVEVVSHPCVKQGEAFVIPPKRYMRIGSWDISFKVPGEPEDKIVFDQPSNAGKEFRSYTEQSIFGSHPAKSLKISGFTNSV